ncbi:protein FAM186A [Arvicola amphibius]|uniref:protein FAM186A n=1 Tax=Arvicola amphibius TaxID=1047088 RepID=UPI001C095D6E|nr:protein FAM186A [Arvicola amphibius]
MNKVELIMTRYTIDSSSPGRKGSLTENQKKKRKVFLEKITEYINTIDLRERILIKLLSWMEEWNFLLSDVAEIDIDDYYHWAAEMEIMPETLKAIDTNVSTLCQITVSLFEEKKRQKKKLLTRGTLWKAWKERVVKRPATAHALRPDQMICDQLAVNTKVSEIQDMLQELISTGMFSKLENNAIKYISATLLNLSKALRTVNEELKLISSQFRNMVGDEEEEGEEEKKEKEIPQKAFQHLCEENEKLHQRLKESEEKSEQLIRIKNFLGRQLLFPSVSFRTLLAKIPIGKDMEPGETDILLNKELENIMDESQKKGVGVPAIKWDSTMSHIAQGEAAPEAAKLLVEDQVDHAQRKLYLPSLQSVETLAANLEEEKVVSESETSEFSDLQALDVKRKGEKSFLEGKPKGQGVQSGTGNMWERLKKVKSQNSLGKSPVPSEAKIEPTVRPKEKEAKTEVELPKIIQPEIPEPPKTETKGKKPVPGKTEDMPGSTKAHSKLQPRTPKQMTVSPEGRSNLESFQRAILAFLREKMNNVGKAFDPKIIQEEEDALGRVEVEKLNTIKLKMEEYIQKVTETVTKTVRTYKEARKKQFREMVIKQKLALTTPQLHPKQTFMSSKAEIRNVLLSEMTDPVIRKLVQTLLDELEGEWEGTTVGRRMEERQEPQKQEEEAWKEEQRLQRESEQKQRGRERAEQLGEWRQTSEGSEASQAQETDKEKPKAVREAEDGQRLKGSKLKQLVKAEGQAKELSKMFTQSAVVLTSRSMKVLKPPTSQVPLFQVDPDTVEPLEEKQPSSSRATLGFAQLLPRSVPELAQIASISMPQAPSGPPSHGHMRKAQSAPPTAEEERELGSQLTVPGILEQTSTPEQMQIPQTTAEQVQISGVTVTQRTVLPLQQIQAKDITLTSQEVLGQGITLTPEQAQALGITLTPEQAKAHRISLTPLQAQTLGITLTPEQTKAQRISLTPQQAQTLGITLTPWQAQGLGLTLTPEQTKAQRVSLTPQQAQVLGVSLTPQQVQAQRINLTPEQAQALGVSLTPEQAQALGITLTPEQAQALGIICLTPQAAKAMGITLTPEQANRLTISLTPQQVQALGITLTLEQVRAQRVSLTPEQAQALGITLTPKQAKALGMICLTPQQTLAMGITLTPEQANTLTISLTPQQVQALGITLTLEQARVQRISITPEQAQALGITLTPEQAQVLGLTLTPQQAQINKICLTPQQTQAMGITLTPEQANTLTISLTPQQVQALGITLTLEQARAQRISITPEQAQTLGITLSPEQAQALGIISLSPEDAQVLGLTLTPQQAQINKICLTPQQTQAMGITLTPEQANTLTISLTPQQVQALGITLTLEQARAQRISITPEQAQTLGITLSPEQAQALGIAEALGDTFTPEPGKEQRVSLTPEQVEALRITPIPKQSSQQEISLSPEDAQVLGLTLTPQQAQINKICLTPQQTQAMGITLTPEQANRLTISLTPQQVQALGITLTLEQARVQRISITPEQAQTLGITLSPEQAQALGIAEALGDTFKEQRVSLTPEQVEALRITPTPKQSLPQEISLSPEDAQVLGLTLTPQQAQINKICLTPQQAQAMGITLTPEQANTLTISLTPQQVQALGITLTLEQARVQRISITPEQAQALGITLSPEQVQVLGLKLTPQQAQINKICLTPQQAQAMGITLTPEQANTLTISLTPQQVQALGITLTLEQARAQRISITPEQAQALGITLTPEQAQALRIAPTLQQAEALEVTLTPEQVQALKISPTPEQTHTLGISLSSQQARDLGITLTPRQAKVQKICLTPEQAQALGVTFTPEQAKERRSSLTPQQARALGLTLSPVQARAQRIILTPEQADALGITLSPEQAEALGISFTPSRLQKKGTLPPKKFQGLEATLTHKQAATLRGRPTTEQIQPLKIPIIPASIQTPKPAVASKQTQTIEIPLSTQWSQQFGVPLPQRQGKVLGTNLTPGQTQVFEQVQALQLPRTPWQTPLPGQLGPGETQTLMFTITLDRAQDLGVIFTQEQTQAAAVTLTSEQVAALEDALTEELAWKWGGLIMPEKVQRAANVITPEQLQAPRIARYQPAFRIPLTSEKPAALVSSPDRLLQQLQDFPLAIPLQKLRQTPLPPRIGLGLNILPDSEKLEEPHLSPTYKQIRTDRGQVTPTQLLTPEVPPTRRQLPKPETPSTPELPFAPWHFFKTGDIQPPLIPGIPFPSKRLTPPPTAGVLPTSGEFPGGFDVSKNLLLSRLFPYQPPAIHEQVPFMQGQQRPPLIIAEQEESSLRITPVPLHPSTAEELSIPGEPQRISPSSVPQKWSGAVSPPKPEPARAHPSASLAPFPTEKIRIAKVPDTLEETGVLQDSFDMKPLGMFQPYVTSSGIPGSKLPHIGEKAPSGLEKPTATLASLSPQLSQTSQAVPSARGQRPRLPAIDKPWILTPASDTRKAKAMGSPLTAQLPEDRYFVDVEAQRKNLVILNEAAQTSGFPSQYHTIARNLIIELLHMNTVRLGYLCRKYVAYRLIQLARNNIIRRLKAIQNTGKGYETQNLYIMLDRTDKYQKRVMRFWTDKQKQLEQRRKQCLCFMTQLFSQIEKVFKLNLSQPVPLVSGFKQIPDFTKIQRPVLELFIEDNKKPDIFKTFGYVQTQMESIWNADLSTSSYPIMEKTSLNTLWAQLGGYPDIPRLLQLDIQWTFRKALASLGSQ